MAGGFSFGGPVPPSTGAGAPAPPSVATGAAAATANGDTSTPTSSSPPSVRALAWDPTGPASLTLCPLPSHACGGGKDDKKESIDLDVFLSHDGTGCPSPEAECLLRCLDARDEWLAVQTRQGGGRRWVGRGRGGGCVTNLSMDYRAALCECLMRLQSQAEGDGGGVQKMKEGEGEEGNNLELLSLTYALSHLAEIFLLPPPASTNASTYPSTMMDGGFPDAGGRRLDGPPGSLTADAVRYLRLHHTSAASLLDIPAVVEMLDHDQPEYYQSSASSIPGPYDRPYWNLLLKLVLTGRLADAWAVLSRHAACRRAEEAARDEGALSPEGEGFSALRALFLAAPLPGGRGDGYGDDAGLDDYLEEETLELDGIGEDEEDDDAEEAVDPGDIDEPLIDGLDSGSYLLWEPRPRHADKLRTLRYRRDLRNCGRADVAVELGSAESPTVPEMYQPRVALNAFQLWQDMVRATAFPAGVEGRDHGALTALFGRFPPLKQICSLLLGSIPTSVAQDPSVTWSESLLAELLYSRPDIRPEDVAARANVAMTKAGGGKRALEQIILGIMGGSAGQVVETMFSLCGGASGAALPAAMTSLLCTLLVDAGCMPAQKDAASVHIPTELLLLAAESILSSFSVQAQSDVGVRTAVRLLLPHAPPRRGTADGDDVVYEPRLAATIAEALSHRLPATDAEARDLLQLCEGAVRRGAVPLADACESLAFGRASVHRTTGDLAREVHWLLRGMEVQSCWLPEDRRRKLGFASRRHFDALCARTAQRLVCRLSRAAIVGVSESRRATDEQEREVASAIRAAEAVLEGVLQAEDVAPVLRGHIEANLLEQAVDMAMADAEGDTARVATGIVQCLEERCLSEEYGGVVSTLSDPKLYVEFLNIAFAILAKEEAASQGKPMELATCAFTVHGMHILMARLTQVLSWEGIICSDGSSLSKQPTEEKKEYFNSMRQALCRGLMRAFVENKQSALAKTTSSKEEGGQLSPEEEIELMLSPCI